jgi:hypothetical protein
VLPPAPAYVGGPAPAAAPAAAPLTESQRLIHLASPPVDSVAIVRDPRAAPKGDVVLEGASADDIERLAGELPAVGPRMVYGLVVDRPGDMVALYKAVAICLKAKLPDELARQVADRKRGATGWLYNVVRFESGAHYLSLREYIKPELYAVDS